MIAHNLWRIATGILLCLVLPQSACNSELVRPWSEAESRHLPPALPEADYTPAVVPNGSTSPYKVVDGVKIIHLTAEPVTLTVASGLVVHTWGFNGSVPGPLIELGEGDRVRIYVTNRLPAPVTVHWHGLVIPCGMDGVSGLTQPAISSGETYVYAFTVSHAGTFMYHSHHDAMTQEGAGLVGMLVVHKREPQVTRRPDRDFVILLHEWTVKVGAARPDVNAMDGFNILTMNGKVMPDTEPLVAKIGDRVWIRYGNLSAMDHHPIHLHGYTFRIIGTDGGWASEDAQLIPETTVMVPVGTTRVIELIADNPGDWLFHCHMTHHTMNQMGHAYPNVLMSDMEHVDQKIRKVIPGYHTMGTTGMIDMSRTGMPLPPNSIPMRGFKGAFGQTTLGGMANILRIRDGMTSYADPGPYPFPRGTQARPATQQEMIQDIGPS